MTTPDQPEPPAPTGPTGPSPEPGTTPLPPSFAQPGGGTAPPPPAAGPVPAAPPSWATPSAPPRPVARPSQAGIVAGVILVVVGGLFLVARLADLTLGANAWPLWIVVPGLGMFIASFAIPPRGGLGLAIPGAIVTIVGVILWVQWTYDLHATWAYAWALVAPTGVGIAMLTYGVVKGDRGLAGDGLRTTLVGIALFIGFGLFFEGVLGLSGERFAGVEDVLPVVAIGLGALLVVLSLFGRGGDRQQA